MLLSFQIFLTERVLWRVLAGPFSHRTMLTLEEKGIPYNKLLIDELNMPEW